jgi:hypothetical protein
MSLLKVYKTRDTVLVQYYVIVIDVIVSNTLPVTRINGVSYQIKLVSKKI